MRTFPIFNASSFIASLLHSVKVLTCQRFFYKKSGFWVKNRSSAAFSWVEAEVLLNRVSSMETNTTPLLSSIERFSDLSVPMEVRVGQRMMTVMEVCRLETGTVLALDRLAGETLDLIVGDVHLASAEVVVIEDRLAVRITEFNPRAGVQTVPPDVVAAAPVGRDDAVKTIVQGFVSAFDSVVGSMISDGVRTKWRPVEGMPYEKSGDNWLWWSETFSIFQGPALWVGGPRASWMALGQSIFSSLGVEQPSAEDIEATCRDVVAQSVSALAQKLAKQANTGITSGDASIASLPTKGFSVALTVEVSRNPTELPLIAVFDEVLFQPLSDELHHNAPPRPSKTPVLPPVIASLQVGVQVVLGRTRRLLEDVFQMTVGSVIELGRSVNDPVDILINGRLIARGQVMLCGSSYGVKIVSKFSRIQSGSEG